MLKTLLNILPVNCKNFLLIIFFCSVSIAQAQELLMTVTIDDQQYTNADKSIFNQIKVDIENFVNNKAWTEDSYEEIERINCSLILTILPSSSLTQFNCQAQIVSTRPIYNSIQETISLSYVDEIFNFGYTQGMNLEYNDNSYTTELTSLLAFYSYMILGSDYDSFSLNGGADYFLLANQVLNNHVNPSSENGWAANSTDPNTRYWLIENAINPQFIAFSKSIYTYHRTGLDIITLQTNDALKNMITSLKTLETLKNLNQTSVLISSYCVGKRTEFVTIFKGLSSTADKDEVIRLLRSLDPVNSENYLKIKENY